jgi:hypothetical protein
MSMKDRVTEVAEKLRDLKEKTDDRYETTPSILRNTGHFFEFELEDVISELDEIANKVGDLEEELDNE